MGTWQYGRWPSATGCPIVVTGFEPLDVLDGIRRVVVQLEAGRGARSRTPTPRAVTAEGNVAARSRC